MNFNVITPQIITLEYSEASNCFHFRYEGEAKAKSRLWHAVSENVDELDALKFTEFMYKKYVDGRKSGKLPSLEIVRIEFQLFLRLKNVNRKLTNK